MIWGGAWGGAWGADPPAIRSFVPRPGPLARETPVEVEVKGEVTSLEVRINGAVAYSDGAFSTLYRTRSTVDNLSPGILLTILPGFGWPIGPVNLSVSAWNEVGDEAHQGGWDPPPS